MNQSLYILKKKQIEQKKQRFDDVTFSMTSFCAKKLKILDLLGEEKNPKH